MTFCQPQPGDKGWSSKKKKKKKILAAKEHHEVGLTSWLSFSLTSNGSSQIWTITDLTWMTRSRGNGLCAVNGPLTMECTNFLHLFRFTSCKQKVLINLLSRKTKTQDISQFRNKQTQKDYLLETSGEVKLVRKHNFDVIKVEGPAPVCCLHNSSGKVFSLHF